VTVRVPPPDEAIAAVCDAPTVCIPWHGEPAAARATLAGVLAHTPPHVPVVLAGAGEHDLEAVTAGLADGGIGVRAISALALGSGAGFAGAANAAADAAAGEDLALVAPGVLVGPEWLGRLQAAARCDSTVVSATALGDRAGALTVAAAPPPVPNGHDGEPDRSAEAELQPDADAARPHEALAQPAAALAVIARSPRAHPRIASAGAHCVYLRRALLDRVGGFDEGIADPDEALAELSLRGLALGMIHVAADDVFVLCPDRAAPRSVGSSSPLCSPVLAADRDDERSVLRRSIACARVALHGMSVTIDARALGPRVGGTQVYTVQLILALAATPGLRLRAVVPPDLPQAVAHRFRQEPRVEVITYEQAVAGVRPSDVVHRPQQVFSEDDLGLLHLLGERVVIGQQDLIAYRNPAYHETVEDWQRYRRVTRLALAVADRAVFFSEHALRDTVAEELVEGERSAVVGVGADTSGDTAPAAPPPGVPLDRDLLVCLGADYAHKNRPFAIALAAALRRRHGWEGALVLAGPHVPFGSSREEELALLAAHPELAGSVLDIGPVDDGQRTWLYERARAVVYPTLYEGFGLVPFEAARAGVPCLFAPQSSLVELAGPDAATLVAWDAQRSADAVAPLLRDGPERERHLCLLGDGAQRARWRDVVERLLATYEEAIGAPQRAAAPRAWQALQRERFIASLGEDLEHVKTVAEDHQAAYRDLQASVGIGLPLVADGGLLSRDEQRGLMRVASRRSLHALLLGPLGLLGRLGRR